MSRCVCTSMPPGRTKWLPASRTRPAFSVGSPAPIAEILSPAMPTSATDVSVAVTTVPFRITVSKRICALDLNCGFGNRLVVRKNIPSVDVQGLFFVAAHQIYVELRNADLPQRLQLL